VILRHAATRAGMSPKNDCRSCCILPGESVEASSSPGGPQRAVHGRYRTDGPPTAGCSRSCGWFGRGRSTVARVGLLRRAGGFRSVTVSPLAAPVRPHRHELAQPLRFAWGHTDPSHSNFRPRRRR
jgi:hypothetical protein